MINNIQQLLAWTLSQRKNEIGVDNYLEGRISAIQDCIALINETVDSLDVDYIINRLDGIDGGDQYSYDEGFRKGFETAVDKLTDNQ